MNSNIRFDYPRLFTNDEIPEYPRLPTNDEVPGSWSLRGSGGLLKGFLVARWFLRRSGTKGFEGFRTQKSLAYITSSQWNSPSGLPSDLRSCPHRHNVSSLVHD